MNLHLCEWIWSQGFDIIIIIMIIMGSFERLLHLK